MKLEAILTNLEKARIAHLRWVARAEALVAGVALDKSQVPMLSTDCEFGRWYHGEGWALRDSTSYEALDKPHKALHATYMEIFNILYGEKELSMLEKLFGSKKAQHEQDLEDAKALMPKLTRESKMVIAALDLLERELKIISKNGNLPTA